MPAPECDAFGMSDLLDLLRSDRDIVAPDLIRREREEAERLLADPATGPVYGFTTLLGPLDHLPAVDASQELLDGHLVGRQDPAPDGLIRRLTRAKLLELSAGGSAVSPETFDRILAIQHEDRAGFGAWRASYGSGDVVPAAWWLRAALGGPDGLRPGDLIACLSGGFVAAGVASLAADRLRVVFDRILEALMPDCVAPVPRDGDSPLVELASRGFRRNEPVVDIQLPVSQRDVRPVIEAAVLAVDMLEGAIDRRLRTPGPNPLLADGAFRSQCAFLDVGLAMGCRGAGSALAFALAALHRRIQRAQAERPGEIAAVQPPKVARALLAEAHALLAMPPAQPIDESGGVEDLADGALQAAWALWDACELAEQMLDLEHSIR